MSSRHSHRFLTNFVSLAVFVVAFVAVVFVSPSSARATTVDYAYSMHSCRFSAFNDATTCPASGYCAPPAVLTGLNIFTVDEGKLQPRGESTAGMPLSFICPVTRVLSGAAASIQAEVAGGAASDAALSCTLYSVTKSGALTGSSTKTVTGTIDQVIRNLKVAASGSDDTYNIVCTLPVFQPTKLTRTGWTATATASNGGEPASNLVDATAGTRWSTGVKMNTGPQSFTIDMKASKEIQRVVMDSTGSNNDYARAYKIEVSSDNLTWAPPLITSTGTGPVVTADFISRTGRYVRVTQTGSANFWWSIYDVNVWARNVNGITATLNSYRAEEVSSSTNVKSRTFPATVCTPKAPKTLTAKVRYLYDGLVNRDTTDTVVECALANPFDSGLPRTATVALTEAKANGGSWCHLTSRYAFYDDDYAPGISTLVTGVAGPFTWSFPDSTNYGDYVRFGFECSLTPGSAIRMLRLTTQ